MLRSMSLALLVVALIGMVAADQDVSDLLFKDLSDQQSGPQAVAPQRVLLSYRGLSAVYSPKPASPKPASPKPASPKPASPKPASPKPATPKRSPPPPRVCYQPATSNGNIYIVDITTYNRRIKEFSDIEYIYANYILDRWPAQYGLPDITPYQNNEKPVKKTSALSTWRFAIRAYLSPCPTTKKAQDEKEVIRRKMKAKLVATVNKKGKKDYAAQALAPYIFQARLISEQ